MFRCFKYFLFYSISFPFQFKEVISFNAITSIFSACSSGCAVCDFTEDRSGTICSQCHSRYALMSNNACIGKTSNVHFGLSPCIVVVAIEYVITIYVHLSTSFTADIVILMLTVIHFIYYSITACAANCQDCRQSATTSSTTCTTCFTNFLLNAAGGATQCLCKFENKFRCVLRICLISENG